jgi:hypothetical protein
MAKEKGKKDRQIMIYKTLQKTKEWETQTPLRIESELWKG